MKRVILVGFMGCGKTTLGKKLAKHIDVPFIDSDAEIEAHYQKTIGELFTEKGELNFRAIENEFIHTLNDRDDFVLATGGGMPCFGSNMNILNSAGITFYMERSAKELTHRLMRAKNKRPLIDGMSEVELLRFIQDRLILREDYYKKALVTLNREEQTTESIQYYLEHLSPLGAHQKN